MTTQTPPPQRPAHGIGRGLALFMALAAGVGTATIYLLQPSTSRVAADLGVPISAVGVVLAFGPLGYLCGLVVLVPLVDRYSPARVLAAQFAGLAAALGLSALTPWATVLAVLVGATGAGSVIGAGMSTLAGRLSVPERRARTVGVVTAGISAGILAGRIVGGFLADQLGWRPMLVVIAAVCAVLAVACWVLVPSEHAGASGGYLASLLSMPGLFLQHVALRIAALRGALWFFGFCAVWAGLAVALSEPPFSYSAERIGLYALAGLAGVVSTWVAGSWTDRVGARRVVLAGLLLALVAVVVCAVGLSSTPLTVIGLACFDAGLFAAQVANQSTVLAIDPAAPARFNSAYMVVYFVGGSLGTAFGAAAVGWFGWTATALVVGAAIVAAGTITALSPAQSG